MLNQRHLLNVTGVDEHQLEVVFEEVPDRLPTDPGCFHHDLRHAVRRKPVTQASSPRTVV